MTAAFDQVAMGLDAGTPVLLASVSEPDAIRVLLIKDGAIDCGFLVNELSEQGFAVQTVASLAGAPDGVGNADVIVFHCDWTKVSSIDVLDKLQRQAAGVPIVLLTDVASPAREGQALDRGAIDVIGQSRSSGVLARRLKDVVKAFGRRDQPQAGEMTCGKLLLRPDVSRAYWKDADVGLTPGEHNIVHLLASNAGRYMTYRAIYDRLHYEGFIAGAGADGYRANVRSAIKRIRNKFRSFDPTFDEIENYNGFGYCWRKPI
ncbi:MAG TPA: winged helix-turn-helix domain-containing protein [Bradyrhizobium sp.]|jgi:two-component system response regulator ChvI|nr:winged helix-turn-helix domain-containing protein [Bradyrhizobium sp.]